MTLSFFGTRNVDVSLLSQRDQARIQPSDSTASSEEPVTLLTTDKSETASGLLTDIPARLSAEHHRRYLLATVIGAEAVRCQRSERFLEETFVPVAADGRHKDRRL